MVSTAALIAALQGQFAAARQGQGQGATAGLPGLLASGNGEGGVNALASGGIAGGGIPGTATTGAGVVSGLGGESLGSLDPITQQVIRSFRLNNERSEPGDLGAGVTGGDVETLLSVLGGPMAVPAILASLVGSSALGLPPTTNLNALLGGGGSEIGSLGISNAQRDTGLTGPVSTGLSPPGSQNLGSLGIRREDRDRSGPPRSSRSNSRQFDTPEFGA